MRSYLLPLLVASSMALPTSAAAAPYDNTDVRPGAFVGARIQLPLGGKSSRKARAALAIAPTSSRISDGSIVQTRIGEGITLSFGSKPNLSLAGVRADRALGLVSVKGLDSGEKVGLSKGGWIAVGVGAVVLGAAIYGFSVYDEARDNTD